MDNEETGRCDAEEGDRWGWTLLAEEGGPREVLEGGRDLVWREFDMIHIFVFAALCFNEKYTVLRWAFKS